MAESNGQPIAFTPLPAPHNSVSLEVEPWLDPWSDEVAWYWLHYRGTDEALIAAGVATPELLAKGRRGYTRKTSAGDRCFLKRWKNGCTQIEIAITPERAESMPGFRVRARSRTPCLRLVVDNTRKLNP